MSLGDDDEILQDFIVEAGEIIEALSEQLVDLEQRPDDKDLLNAIFRGFHTVKGGAGFLQLNTMVDCCHVTENLFDILRNGKRSVTPELMDVVLQALDTVTRQFAQVSSGEEPAPADPALIAQLERLVSCQDIADSSAEPEPVSTDNENSLDLTDDEFEGFLDAIDESAQTKDVVSDEKSEPGEPANAEGEITEDEFEALLDQLHGSGNGPGKGPGTPATEKPSSLAQDSSDEITEDEFESLLDQLHGAGKNPTGSSNDNKGDSSSSTITDDEFEDLLDQLHGKGKGPATKKDGEPDIKPDPVSAAVAPPPEPVSISKANAPAATSNDEAPVSKPVASAAPKPRESVTTASSQVSSGEATVRVDTQRLDDIMNMVGELVLVRNRLVRLGLESSDESMQKAVANLDVVTADLQTAVMKTRMQPIKKVFGRFPRVVRDLARNLKKEINLELQGEDTDLDKNLVEALADPLVHLVRNSVDHGIELPAERDRKGKSRIGKVTLSAEQEGDHILLAITDDGGGMDPQKLRDKAVEKGILDEDSAGRLSDIEAFNLIFAPGFSTKAEISDVSGRGVGMDVVKTKITQLNGSIDIDSKLGEGTRIAIKVPLTLAIMPTLMIMLANQTFALPLVSVNEIFHMDLTHSNVVDGQECVTIRDKAIPIFHLKRWLVKKPVLVAEPGESHVVIVSVGTQRVGFVVDQLIGQEEVVIKPLGKMLQGTPGMAGATITGDGTIALILDVPSMLKRYAKTA